MATRIVQGACPHDCPDTCALHVTVEDGRATRVQGDPDHPLTDGALCTKVSRYTERTYHPERVLHPLRRVGPKGAGRFERVSWDEALDDIAARLKAIAARDPQASRALQLRRHHGPGAGRGHGGALLPPARRLAARPHHLLGGRRRGARRDLWRARSACITEYFAESQLIVIWGSNSITSNLHFWTLRAGGQAPRREALVHRSAPHRDRRQVPPPPRAAARHRRRAGAGADARADHAATGSTTTTSPATSLASTRCASGRCLAARARGGGLRHAGRRRSASWRATTAPRSRPAIRLNYGMQRVHGGGNAVRLIALLPCLTGAWRHRAGGLLLSASGWFKPVTRRRRAAAARPAGRTPAAHDQHEHDRRRPAARGIARRSARRSRRWSSTTATRWRWRPSRRKVVRAFAREDLFTVVLEHFLTDTADHADYVLPATTQLEHLDVHTSYGHTYVLLNEPAIAPLGEAKPNTQIFRELAQRMGFTEPCFADDDETLARTALPQRRLRRAAQQGLGHAAAARGAVRRTAASRRPTARRESIAPGLRRARLRAEVRVPRVARRQLAARYPLAMISPPARNFLNSSFVNVKSLRDIEGEPLLEMHAGRRRRARHRRRRDGARLQRPRRLPLPRRGQRRARARAWSTAWASGGASSGLAGTNVNELTTSGSPTSARADVLRLPGRGGARLTHEHD